VKTFDLGWVYVVGDLFEKEEDLVDPEIWRSAGSDNPDLQVGHRQKVVQQADYIVPGHGPMFQVTQEHKNKIAENS
jgi:hypothetical protein